MKSRLPELLPLLPVIVKDYNNGLSQTQLSDKYKIPRTSLARLLARSPDYNPRQQEVTPEFRRQIFDDYSSGMNHSAIGKKHGISQSRVCQLLQECDGYKARPFQGYKSVWTPAKIDEAKTLYATGVPLAEVARQMGSNPFRVRDALRSIGVEIRPQGEAQSGKYNPSWNGGRVLNGGYWHIHRPDHPFATKNGYVSEHRLVVEKEIGRYLTATEVVHHKDGNPQNNDPANLQLFASNGEHLAFDLKGRVPKWSEDGKRRILEALKKPQKRPHNHDHPKNDEPQLQLVDGHPET